jgi:isoamylase
MYLSGLAIHSRGPRGETITDDSFLLLLHAGSDPCPFTLPHRPWAASYSLEVATYAGAPIRTDAGGILLLPPRSALLLRVGH